MLVALGLSVAVSAVAPLMLLGSRARKKRVDEKNELQGGLAEEDDKPEEEEAERRRWKEAQRVHKMQRTAHPDE